MTPSALTKLIDATWPAHSFLDVGDWTIREGKGGGSRVSAATAMSTARLEEHSLAEDAMRGLGQTPQFMVRDGEDALDAMLADHGYVIKDPVTYYTAPTATLATEKPATTSCFPVWPPLTSQADIWAAGGIDDARLAIMDRAKGSKTTCLGRVHDTPAGTAFVAIHNGTAMLHAIETSHGFRRQGLGRQMVRTLAFWAQDHGAHTCALLVTKANIGANTLYASLGMTPVGGYHYRILKEA